MFARDLITDEIPPLKISDTGLKALQWMEEFKVSHLPIIDGLEFLGIISDSDIFDLNIPKDALANHKLTLMRPFVYETEHLYEIIKLANKLKLTVVPVLSQENKYVGAIALVNLVHSLAEMSSIKDIGGVVVLELNVNDYSLSEISRIVEENDAKILSVYVTSRTDSTKLELTIKINRTDLSAILQTFNRYNYTVKASYHQTEFSEETKNRYDSFMNYLNI